MTDIAVSDGGAVAPTSEQPSPTAVPTYAGTKHKVKIDSQELEVPYEELLAGYQTKQASNKRFQEAAERGKSVEAQERMLRETLERAKTDEEFLAQVLKSYGIDPDQWSEKRVRKLLTREMMPEAERKALDAQERADKLEAQLKTREQKDQEARVQALQAQASQEIEKEVLSVLSEAGIKPTWEVIAEFASQMEASIDVKGQRLDAKSTLTNVHKKMERQMSAWWEGLPDEELLKRIPQSVQDRIRKAEIAKLQQNKPFQTPAPGKQAPASTPAKKKVLSTDEFFKLKEKQLRG